MRIQRGACPKSFLVINCNCYEIARHRACAIFPSSHSRKIPWSSSSYADIAEIFCSMFCVQFKWISSLWKILRSPLTEKSRVIRFIFIPQFYEKQESADTNQKESFARMSLARMLQTFHRNRITLKLFESASVFKYTSSFASLNYMIYHRESNRLILSTYVCEN